MLVLGSLGLGPLSGFMTGSVSRRVVARCTRPVVLVRAGRGATEDHLPAVDGVAPDEIAATPYREVVLGLDTDRPCDEAIAFAFEAARCRGTGLRVVHAFRVPVRPASDASLVTAPPASPGPVPAPRAPVTAQARADAERAVTAALRAWRERYPSVPVTESVTEERAAVAVVRAAHGGRPPRGGPPRDRAPHRSPHGHGHACRAAPRRLPRGRGTARLSVPPGHRRGPPVGGGKPHSTPGRGRP